MLFNNVSTMLSKIARHNSIIRNSRFLHMSSSYLNKSPKDELSNDEPIQFSTSKAANWSVKNTYGEPFDPKIRPPPYQPYVVAISTLIFMIYFFVLREENDLDINLTRPLSEHGIHIKFDN